MKDLNKRNKYLHKKVAQPVENDWEEDVYSETTNTKWYNEVGLFIYQPKFILKVHLQTVSNFSKRSKN